MARTIYSDLMQSRALLRSNRMRSARRLQRRLAAYLANPDQYPTYRFSTGDYSYGDQALDAIRHMIALYAKEARHHNREWLRYRRENRSVRARLAAIDAEYDAELARIDAFVPAF